MRASSRTAFGVILILAFTVMVGETAASSSPAESGDWPRWQWPLTGSHTVAAPFRAPTHEYGPGHRGVDLDSSLDAAVIAPEGGVVAFRGTVVDRPLLTIEHPNGLVSTFEPVRSALTPGATVTAGQEIGSVAAGGHTPLGDLHLGVRSDGRYLDPLLLFGRPARAVLLPCCARL